MLTLKQFKGRTLVCNRNLSAIPMPRVALGLNHFADKVGTLKYGNGSQVEPMIHPETEALWFYLTNHAMAVLQRTFDPAEPLPAAYAEVARNYHHDLEIRALRMYGYLMRICTRESRHSNANGFMSAYPEMASWYAGYQKKGPTQALAGLLENTPKVEQARYTQFLRDSFYKGSFSGGYGGPAWGQIADVLHQFVTGKITGEIMLDTAFTLCHNNGSIFNKGMLYMGHTTSALNALLDVQRAGMIPGLICDVDRYKKGTCSIGGIYSSKDFVTGPMVALCNTMAALSSDFSARVEWPRLPELGAVFNHSHKIEAFHKLHGVKVDKVAELKAKKAAAEMAAKNASKWQILPGVFAHKFTPKRVSAA